LLVVLVASCHHASAWLRAAHSVAGCVTWFTATHQRGSAAPLHPSHLVVVSCSAGTYDFERSGMVRKHQLAVFEYSTPEVMAAAAAATTVLKPALKRPAAGGADGRVVEDDLFGDADMDRLGAYVAPATAVAAPTAAPIAPVAAPAPTQAARAVTTAAATPTALAAAAQQPAMGDGQQAHDGDDVGPGIDMEGVPQVGVWRSQL
jgi:hypothetical protein